MSDIMNQNTNDSGIETSGLKDVDLSLYGISVTEEGVPDDDDGYTSLYGSDVPEEEMPVEDDGGPQGGLRNDTESRDELNFVETRSAIDIMRNAVAYWYGHEPWRLEDLEDKERADDIRKNVIASAKVEAQARNQNRASGDKVKIPQQLPVEIACEMIRVTGDIAVLVTEKGGDGTLVYYSRTGDEAGTWATDASLRGKRLRKLLDNLDVPVPMRSYADDVLLAVLGEIVENNNDALVAMQNGVVDISDRDNPVFTPYLADDGGPNPQYEDTYGREACLCHKNMANWDPDAEDTTLRCADGTPWNVEDHLELVFAGNADAIKVWWQSCNFALRGMPGGRTMWYMDDSENGQGGGAKSTTAEMVAALIGKKAVLQINMDRLQKDFGLANLVGKRLLIGHETNAGTKPIEGTDVIKSIARGEAVQVERKHENAFQYQPHAMVIQCFNTRSPKIKEKEAAFYRKVVILDFPATLAKDRQHDEIKEKLIYDQRVLDYIASKALSLGAITEYDPNAVAELRKGVDEIRTASSTVYQFMEEFRDTTRNVGIPTEILYECYKNWCKVNGFGGTNVTNFESDLRSWAGMDGEWAFKNYRSDEGKGAKRIPADFQPEEIVAQYGSARIRKDANLANTSIQCGAGALNASTAKKQYRKWMERSDRNNDARDEMLSLLQRYMEFKIAFSFGYRSLLQKDMVKIPSLERWRELGQPMPYFGVLDGQKPLSHDNYGLSGFKAFVGGHDYGRRLSDYCVA